MIFTGKMQIIRGLQLAIVLPIVMGFILISIFACQKKTHSEIDTIDEAMDDLDHGRADAAIEKLSGVSRYNNTPRVMSLLASAYLFRANISTQEIVDIFLEFSINKKSMPTSDTSDQLKNFTFSMLTLNEFLQKLALVPLITSKNQLSDLNKAIFYLSLSKPITPGIALQRGLIRLILAKYKLNFTLHTLFAAETEGQKCELHWHEFLQGLLSFSELTQEMLTDLIIAQPKNRSTWEESQRSLATFTEQIKSYEHTSTEQKEPEANSTLNPMMRELLIQFLRDNHFLNGCEP